MDCLKAREIALYTDTRNDVGADDSAACNGRGARLHAVANNEAACCLGAVETRTYFGNDVSAWMGLAGRGGVTRAMVEERKRA